MWYCITPNFQGSVANRYFNHKTFKVAYEGPRDYAHRMEIIRREIFAEASKSTKISCCTVIDSKPCWHTFIAKWNFNVGTTLKHYYIKWNLYSILWISNPHYLLYTGIGKFGNVNFGQIIEFGRKSLLIHFHVTWGIRFKILANYLKFYQICKNVFTKIFVLMVCTMLVLKLT